MTRATPAANTAHDMAEDTPYRRQYLNITALRVPINRLIHVGAMPHICSKACRFRRTRHINSPKPHYLAHQPPIDPEKIMSINRFAAPPLDETGV